MGSVQEDIRGDYEGEWRLSRSEYTEPWDGKHRDHPNEKKMKHGENPSQKQPGGLWSRGDFACSWFVCFFSCLKAYSSQFARRSKIL